MALSTSIFILKLVFIYFFLDLKGNFSLKPNGSSNCKSSRRIELFLISHLIKEILKWHLIYGERVLFKYKYLIILEALPSNEKKCDNLI